MIEICMTLHRLFYFLQKQHQLLFLQLFFCLSWVIDMMWWLSCSIGLFLSCLCMIIRKLQLIWTLNRTVIISLFPLKKSIFDRSIHRMLGVVISDVFLLCLFLNRRGLVDVLFFGKFEVMFYLWNCLLNLLNTELLVNWFHEGLKRKGNFHLVPNNECLIENR